MSQVQSPPRRMAVLPAIYLQLLCEVAEPFGIPRADLQGLLGLSDDATFRVNLTLANAGLSRISQGSTHRNLISLNEHSHFSGRHRDLLTYR